MSLVRIQSPRPLSHSAQLISVPIRYRRADRALFMQKIQHAVPSIVVLSDGLNHLSHDAHGIELVLGVFEVAAALGVMGSVVYGFRKTFISKHQDDGHHHHGPDWIDIFIGGMLAVEAYAKYHASGHIPRPTILLSLTMFAIGAMHGRLAAFGDRRRSLRIGAEGISVPGLKAFTRMTLPWAEVASIEIDDRAAVITAIDGRSKKIAMSDLKQPQVVRDALMQARTLLDESRHAANASIESATTGA